MIRIPPADTPPALCAACSAAQRDRLHQKIKKEIENVMNKNDVNNTPYRTADIPRCISIGKSVCDRTDGAHLSAPRGRPPAHGKYSGISSLRPSARRIIPSEPDSAVRLRPTGILNIDGKIVRSDVAIKDIDQRINIWRTRERSPRQKPDRTRSGCCRSLCQRAGSAWAVP